MKTLITVNCHFDFQDCHFDDQNICGCNKS